MSRLQIPATIADAPAASQPFLEAVNKKLGVVPNLFRLIANSPAALEGYLGLAGALAKGALPAQTGERIALAVAEINGCDYCMSAHSYLGKNVAKLDDAEMSANRNGGSNEPKGRQGGWLHRCADRRDCRAHRTQRLDELRQRRCKHGD